MLKEWYSNSRLSKLILAFGLIAAQLLSFSPGSRANTASELKTTVQASSQAAKPGDEVALKVLVDSGISRSIHIQLQVVGPNGTAVYQQWAYDKPVAAGGVNEYPFKWTVPEGLPAGNYAVSVGIFGASWDAMYSWDSGLAVIQIQSGATLPGFTAEAAVPPSVEAGSQATIKATLVSDQATAGKVALAIHDSSNALVHEQSFAGVTFAANTATSVSTVWAVPEDAVSGAYRIELTVVGADGSTVYYRNASFGSIQVAQSDPGAGATFQTRAVMDSTTAESGEKFDFSAEIKADRNASVLVDVIVKNPYTNEPVLQAVFERQALTAGGILSIPISWNVPADAPSGRYPIEIGIFGNGWQGPYHWNANAGYVQVGGGSVPPIEFVANTAVAQSVVEAGSPQSFAVTATGSADATAIVQVKVLDPQGLTVFQREFPNERFIARQARSFNASWPVPSTAALGTYSVETGIYSADRSHTYYWNSSAVQFAVEAGTPPPTQPDNGATAVWTTSVVAAETAEAGYPTTVTANVASDDYAKALVDVEIYDEHGSKVYQAVFDHQYFQPNAAKSFPVTWSIPASQPRGQYSVSIGVFPESWGTAWKHHWNGGATDFDVNWGIVPDIAHESNADLEAIVPGQKQTIRTRLTSSETLPATVRLELFDSAGSRVASAEYMADEFVQGVANDYSMDWTPDANSVNGTYKLKVSVAKADGVRVFYSNPEAVQFSLSGGIDLTYSLSAATEQEEVSAGQTLNVSAFVGSTVPSVVSMKINFIDVLTGKIVHSESAYNKPIVIDQETAVDIDWTLPKWIRMNEEKVRSGAEPLIQYILDGDYRVDIELYNADMSQRIATHNGAAAFKVVSPDDAPAPQPAEAPALPDIMKLGVFATNNDDHGITGWMPETGLPWNFAYRYLNGGANNQEGWTSWDPYFVGSWQGAYAYDYAKKATDRGYTPVFTFYQMLQSISGDCLNCDETKDDIITLNDPYAMRAYLEEFKLLMQLIGTGEYNGKPGIGKTAIVHVDPDLAGYAQQAVLDNDRCFGQCTGKGNNPAFLKAAVASTRMPELADLPNTYQGYNWALLRLRDLYAPNVIMAPHVNSWGTLIDVGRDTNPNLDVTALGKLAGEFANLSGAKVVPAGIKPYEYIFNDIDDDDAGGSRGYWLDRTNLTLPNFHRWEQFVKAAVETTGKKAMIWQIPVGNQVYRAMDNTPGHYQDNKAEYFFEHMQELVDIGIVGLMFGHGQPGSTSHYNRMDDNGGAPASADYYNPDPLTFSDGWGDGSVHTNDKEADSTDDDGGYLRMQATEYYKHPIPVSNRY
ncbi:hypothetical protein ACFPVX_10150 [Cohnella faecalis]|uniref:Uncharacterized protein n=1 Tax=Cohnella faecalis TaxID=2315694 RepID=A0A398CWD8_9BACL|nr:hypothetical protein [Cohnella faecalis]RIE03531.1 hypothetical protein D3H35_10800 [Cohnella faecalis]